jgi:hypothetical protein
MLDHLGIRASRQQCRKERILLRPRMINLVDLTCGLGSFGANGFGRPSASLFGLSKAGEPWDIVGCERSKAWHRAWIVEIPLVLRDPDEVANGRIGYPGPS